MIKYFVNTIHHTHGKYIIDQQMFLKIYEQFIYTYIEEYQIHCMTVEFIRYQAPTKLLDNDLKKYILFNVYIITGKV